MELNFGSWLKHKWNVFANKDPYAYRGDIGSGYSVRPDRPRLTRGNERSIITSVFNRIALDVAAISIKHVRLDENERYVATIDSGLNTCLNLEANIDQTGRAFVHDAVMSMMDEGVVALVPVDTDVDPETNSYKIESMRTGKVVEWYPQHVKVRLYNDRTGRGELITYFVRGLPSVFGKLSCSHNTYAHLFVKVLYFPLGIKYYRRIFQVHK